VVARGAIAAMSGDIGNAVVSNHDHPLATGQIDKTWADLRGNRSQRCNLPGALEFAKMMIHE
jgi:hypothetical protein